MTSTGSRLPTAGTGRLTSATRTRRTRDALAGVRDQAAQERNWSAHGRDWDAAAQDRALAAAEQQAAAADRAAAAQDRERAKRDRAAAAGNRLRAAADREQAAVERAQGGRDHPADWLLEEPQPRAQDLRAVAKETSRTATDLVAQLVKAKLGELTAHRAMIQAHEGLAGLREQLGHPDRAAESRAQAERAGEAHRSAAELAAYLGRIEAVEETRGRRRRDQTGRADG